MISWSAPEPHIELIHVSPSLESDSLIFTVQSTRSTVACPQCNKNTSKIHSRYVRIIRDLPVSDQSVELHLLTRKWFCYTAECPVRIFTERYEGVSPNARRTIRTDELLRKIAFSTSCLAAEKVARAANVTVSHDALLNIIKRTKLNPEASPFPRFG